MPVAAVTSPSPSTINMEALIAGGFTHKVSRSHEHETTRENNKGFAFFAHHNALCNLVNFLGLGVGGALPLYLCWDAHHPSPQRPGPALRAGCTMQHVAPRGSAKRRTGAIMPGVPRSPRGSPRSWVHVRNLEAHTAGQLGSPLARGSLGPGGPGLVQ